jgi:methyl-accepting chemotaxis protein
MIGIKTIDFRRSFWYFMAIIKNMGEWVVVQGTSVIEEYQSKVFKIIMIFFTGGCTCAGITFASLKILGFYKNASWMAIGAFIAINVIWDAIAIALIRKSKTDGHLNQNTYEFGKKFFLLVLAVQFNFIIYMIPSRDFWAFISFFVIVMAYYLDLKVLLISIAEMVLSLAVAWTVNGNNTLPVKDEIFVPEMILRLILVTLLFISIFLLVMFVSKYLLNAKKEELEQNTKKAEQALNYITEISDVLNQIAKGNLTFDLKYDYEGEFASIKDALENISESLNSTMNQIRISAGDVSSGANQVSEGAKTLSGVASTQASSLEELSVTICGVADNIKQNAENAELASQKTAAVGNEAVESNRRMNDMLSAMQEISRCSNQIGEIIKTIEDIAFQTNILALNAAVEAARAGNAGKGFAVVADEVRNLASKSSQAAQNTAVLIDNTIKSVKNGTLIADQTANSLETVVSSIETISENISTISKASENQSADVEQIQAAMAQISDVVQSVSATAEESAATSEELSNQAVLLHNQVMKFQLTQNDAGV